MKIQIIEESFDKEQYNNLAIHPLQSWQWGEARMKMKIDVFRIAEYTGKQMKNVFQITFHKIPYTNFKIGYLPRSTFPSKQILGFLTDYAKKNNTIFIKIEPYVLKSEIRNPKSETNSKFKILNSKHPLFPDWTIQLDLTQTEEELLKNMKSKTRYNINLARKKGVIIKEESNEKGFEIFSKLYFETCRRQKYHGHTPTYHKIIWESLKNNIGHILVAYFNNTPLAAYELFYFGKIFYYPYGGTSLEYRNLMASNLLMWEAIRLGKKLGAQLFDMWGALAPNYDHNHPWAGFTRFKEGYGGEFRQFAGSFDLVINPTLYSLYNIAQTVREKYLRFV